MTFAAWKLHNPQAQTMSYGKGSNAVLVFEREVEGKAFRDLWHLSDWRATAAVSGPGVVIVPRA